MLRGTGGFLSNFNEFIRHYFRKHFIFVQCLCTSANLFPTIFQDKRGGNLIN